MAEEIFDIVDELDRVVGQAPRWRVHAQGLRHRAVHVLVGDTSGRVYLQKRADTKDNHPGVWDSSCSGHVDSGEGYLAAAVRELGEELGIELESPLVELFGIPAGPETGNEFVRVFTCSHSGAVRPDPTEISDGRWLEPPQIDSWVAGSPADFSPAFRLVWRLFRRHHP